MLTSDIESKLAIVKSKPTYRGSPERGASLLLKIDNWIKRKNSGMRLCNFTIFVGKANFGDSTFRRGDPREVLWPKPSTCFSSNKIVFLVWCSTSNRVSERWECIKLWVGACWENFFQFIELIWFYINWFKLLTGGPDVPWQFVLGF